MTATGFVASSVYFNLGEVEMSGTGSRQYQVTVPPGYRVAKTNAVKWNLEYESHDDGTPHGLIAILYSPRATIASTTGACPLPTAGPGQFGVLFDSENTEFTQDVELGFADTPAATGESSGQLAKLDKKPSTGVWTLRLFHCLDANDEEPVATFAAGSFIRVDLEAAPAASTGLTSTEIVVIVLIALLVIAVLVAVGMMIWRKSPPS